MLERKIEYTRQKVELAKARAQIKNIESRGERSKWDKIHEEYEGMQELAGKIAEDYQKGGVGELLENPLVQQVIRSILMRQAGGGVDISEREKKIHDVISSLPPDAVEKFLKKIK